MIKNLRTNKIIHESPEWALTRWQHIKGFMFSKPGDRAIIFLFMPPRPISLHMWFVFGAIDIIVLNQKREIIVMKKSFKPWTFWDSGVNGYVLLELPEGTIDKTRSEIGDIVEIPRPPI